MVEKYKTPERGSDSPEQGIKSLKGSVQLDWSKGAEKNLNELVKAITRNGAALEFGEKMALKSIIQDNDTKGYFSEKPTQDMLKLRNSVFGVELANGVLRFSDNQGRFTRGGFPLKEYNSGSTTRFKEAPSADAQKAVEAAEKAAQSKFEQKRIALAMMIEKSKDTRGFKMREDGSYEIGSSEMAIRIKESGLDFYKKTGAERIAVTATALHSDAPSTRSAHWVVDANEYQYDIPQNGKTEKVILKNNHHYVLMPVDGEGAPSRSEVLYDNKTAPDYSRRTFSEEGARIEATKRNLMGVPDTEVSPEQPERVLDRSKRFASTLKHFLDNYYVKLSDSVVAAERDPNAPREVIRYDYHGRAVYADAPQQSENRFYNAQLEDGSSIRVLNKNGEGYKVQTRLDGRGTFTIDAKSNGDFVVTQLGRGEPLFTYNAETQTVEGDFDKFTRFADHMGDQIARTVNDYNRPDLYWKRQVRRQRVDAQRRDDPDIALNS